MPVSSRLPLNIFERCLRPLFEQARKHEQRAVRHPCERCRHIGLCDEPGVRFRIRNFVQQTQQQAQLKDLEASFLNYLSKPIFHAASLTGQRGNLMTAALLLCERDHGRESRT